MNYNWIYNWNMKASERTYKVEKRISSAWGEIRRIFFYDAFAYNGGSFNIKIAFAWRRVARVGRDLPGCSFHATDSVGAELRAEHFNPIVNNLQNAAVMGTSKLLSQITRGRAVILKDCLFQTDVFNLAMQLPIPLLLLA